mgnify:CR=1 FL=1
MMTRKKIQSAIEDLMVDEFGLPRRKETEEEKQERQEWESLQRAEAGPQASEFFHVGDDEEGNF